MMDMKRLVNVKNRSSGVAVYRIPEDNIRRSFAPGETKKLPYEELVHLTYQPGGRELLENFLQVTEEEILDNLNIAAEPEYYMTETQIVEMLKTGSIDQFLDCLDYAPVGIIDLIKQYAVTLPLNDIKKREALKNKTGFDVTAAIVHKQEAEAVDDTPVAQTTETKATVSSGRRTNVSYKPETVEAPAAEAKVESAPVETPKYKVVTTK